MSKPRAKKKGKPHVAETSSFALSLGGVAVETVIAPALTMIVIAVVLARFANFEATEAEIAIIAGFVALRLPFLVYTLAKDRRIVLGKDELHVPIVGVLQVRPWTIPFADLASIEETRKRGGATKIALVVRGHGTKRFAASVLKDRAAVIRAIERRVAH